MSDLPNTRPSGACQFAVALAILGVLGCGDQPVPLDTDPATPTQPATATQLVFATPPPNGLAGTRLAPAVEVSMTDGQGRVVASANGRVTLRLAHNPGGATLQGTLAVDVSNGTATFDDLAIERAATGYTLLATSAGLPGIESAAFDIASGPPSLLAFRDPPSGTALDVPFDPAIEVVSLDAFGNLATAPVDVALALDANPGNALLHGSTTVATINGVATFTDLRLDRVAAGYTLAASSPGLTAAVSPPFDVVLAFQQLSGSVADLAIQDHTCGLTTGGSIYCWGANFYGQLGGANGGSDSDTPVRVLGGHTFTSVAAGVGHTCALTATGDAYCWGINSDGQLGDGNTGTDAGTPVAVQGGHEFSHLIAGLAFTCGLTTGQRAFCWGRNDVGQLGDGNLGTGSPLPVPVVENLAFLSLTRGEYHACGLTSEGTAHCWGANGSGQLGNGAGGGNSDRPVLVTGIFNFTTLAAGGYHTCGVTTSADAYCWGDNSRGQLGDGDLGTDTDTPTPVAGGHRFTQLTGGAAHTCGLTTNGDTMCWGDNTAGELGNGSNETERDTPTHVQPDPAFASLAAGSFHTCGVSTEGTAYCWGWNEWGQLGDGRTGMDRSTPATVANP